MCMFSFQHIVTLSFCTTAMPPVGSTLNTHLQTCIYTYMLPLSDTYLQTHTQIHTCYDSSTHIAVFIDRMLADSVKPHIYPSRNSSEHTDVHFDSLRFTPLPPISPSVMWKNYLLNVTNVCYVQLKEYKFQSSERAWRTA